MLPPLHLVTDDAVLLALPFAERARAALTAGGSELALHLRGPALSGRRLFALAEQLLPAAEAAGPLLLINDRVDVAL
ncbi:MAG TPA: thiamine phosphate synthase, partial [Longimicrobiaceae bacterium]|nr:thiamine phosphate synthase [Longimicrobiaceae bacterium]